MLYSSISNFGGYGAFLSNLALIDPSWPLTSAMRYTLVRVFPIKFASSKELLDVISNLTRIWHQLIPAWALTPSIHYTLPTKFGRHSGHSWAIWPLDDPRWPLHDLLPHQWTTLWPGVLLTVDLVALERFLSNLTSG